MKPSTWIVTIKAEGKEFEVLSRAINEVKAAQSAVRTLKKAAGQPYASLDYPSSPIKVMGVRPR